MKNTPIHSGLSKFLLTGFASLFLNASSDAAVFTWEGTGDNSTITNFNDANSWKDSLGAHVMPTALDSGTFVGLRSSTVNVTTSATIAGLGFDADSYGITLSSSPGAVLTFRPGTGVTFSNKVGALNEISANLDLSGGNCQFAQAGGTTANLSAGQAGTLILSGNITGSGTLTLARAGASNGLTYFTLSGNNSFTGGVRLVAAGATFNIANANALGSGTFQILSTSGQTVNNKTGAALTINNNTRWASGAGLNIGCEVTSPTGLNTVYTTSPVPYVGDITFDGDITLVAGNGTSSTLNLFTGTMVVNGAIGEEAGSRSIRKDGAGTLVLSSTSSTFSGGLTLNGGTVKVASIGSQTDAGSSLGAGSSTLTIGFSTSHNYVVYTGKGETSNRTINIAGTSGTAGIANEGSGKLVLTNLDVTATGNKVIALGGSNSGNNEIQSGIKNATGFTTILNKNDAGKWILSGANTYTGTTTINAGILQFGKVASLYNGTIASWTAANIKVANGATLALNVGGADGFTASNVSTLLGIGGSATTGFMSGSVLGLDTANGDFTYGSAIANAYAGSTLGLTKLGINKLTLSGVNTYSGATTVAAGTLSVNGSLASASTVTVASGATLGGTGTVNGAAIVNGKLAAGDGGIGVLKTGNLTLGSTSTFEAELGSDGMTTSSDLVQVAGSVNIADGAELKLTLAGLSPVYGDIFFLLDNNDTDEIVGKLSYTSDSGLISLTEGTQFRWNNQYWKITYQADAAGSSFTGGNDIALQAVPEPGTWALLVGGFGMLVATQRLRKRSIIG